MRRRRAVRRTQHHRPSLRPVRRWAPSTKSPVDRSGRPRTGGDQLDLAGEMPGELEQMIRGGRELDEVHEVSRSRHQRPANSPNSPRAHDHAPSTSNALHHASPRRLRDAVEPGRVVRERRAVPEEIAAHVGAGAGIGKPVARRRREASGAAGPHGRARRQRDRTRDSRTGPPRAESRGPAIRGAAGPGSTRCPAPEATAPFPGATTRRDRRGNAARRARRCPPHGGRSRRSPLRERGEA